MSVNPEYKAGKISELPEAECRVLLSTTTVGRIAFVDDYLPYFVGVDAEGGADPAEQLATQRLAAGKDAAQPDAVMRDAGLPHQLQRSRRQEHVADTVIGHHLHRRLRFEFAGAVADDDFVRVVERDD